MDWFTKNISRQAIAEHRVSVYALIAANILPLLGVLFLGWSTFAIVGLYWFENVVLGMINVLKMATCVPDHDQVDLASLLKNETDEKTRQAVEEAGSLTSNPWLKHGAKFFFIPFFSVHYGIFCLVHGVFLVTLLGGGGPFGNSAGLQSLDLNLGLILAAVALAASHLVSFFVNYLGKGEYQRTILPVLMAKPYGRIVVLHIAIVLGAFATIMLGSPIILLMILIAGKTLMDLNLHLREHQSGAAEPPAEPLLTTVESKSM